MNSRTHEKTGQFFPDFFGIFLVKGPASQFYWSDWLRCAELRLCSFEARGLWVDMLAYMHQAQPYGHLIFNGKKVDAPMLAKLSGGKPAVVAKLLKEMKDNGVYGVDDNGVIYCRRMVRDELKREAWKHRQQEHRERIKAAEAETNPQSSPQNVTPESRASHSEVIVGVTHSSPRSSVLPYFPSSKQSAREIRAQPKTLALPTRWWTSDPLMNKAGQMLGIGVAHVGESRESYRRRIELEIARRERGDAPPTHPNEGDDCDPRLETLDT